MKNTTQMLETIYKVFIKDLEGMSMEELKTELSHYIEQTIINMESEQIETTYRYLKEMGEA